MILKTLVVDDEEISRKSLERLVNKNLNLELVGSCENGQDGVEFLKNHGVDLILLDVEMPKMNGFGLIEEMESSPYIIMTTTKENYAFDAFKYEIFDYLKKPIMLPTFNSSVQKLISYAETTQLKNDPSEQMSEIYLKVDQRHVRVKFNDILYVENVGNYVKVVSTEDVLIVYTTMKLLEEKLPSNQFIRVHRSFIINLNEINDLEQNSILVGEKLIPIARNSKQALLKKLNML